MKCRKHAWELHVATIPMKIKLTPGSVNYVRPEKFEVLLCVWCFKITNRPPEKKV